MTIVNKKESFVLFIGDVLFLVVALWATLFLRYLNLPNIELWSNHFAPFSFLFVVWIVSFYIAGLYKKHTLVLQKSLPKILFNTQIINIIIAVLFFYFIPYFSITPKTNLFIYLIISFGLIYFWRLFIFNFVTPKSRENALLIYQGDEIENLKHEINNNGRYGFTFSHSIDLDKYEGDNLGAEISRIINDKDIGVVVADINNKKTEQALPDLYNLIFQQIQFIDVYELYEYIFDRVPLSMMNYNWFIENISSKNKIAYDFLKRSMDLIIASFLTIISFVIYPFVIIAILIETKNKPFIIQERIGKNNKKIHLYKFRSMTSNDNGKWITEGDNRVTKVGKIIRASRIDELPQLLNVLKGDISLIGPRPDISGLFDDLSEKLSYYKIRNVVKPGLSGWAQTHQEIPPHSIEETKIRLSYDLYYIKNRSFILDVKIALQTLKTLISRTGK